MIRAEDWFDAALERGLDFLTGVPCSYLKPFINFAISDERTSYVGAASEGEAVGIAAGAWLGGRKTAVLCQGSGLGNMVNPLTSLCWAARIPTMVVTTWRGQPGGKDEPQHALMGRAMQPVLDALEIPHELFPTEESDIVPSLERANAYMADSGLPYAFVMQKGSVAPYALREPAREPLSAPRDVSTEFSGAPELPRREAIEVVLDRVGPDCAILATTGKTGRELFYVADRENHYYHVGAMGCVAGVALGVALTRPERRVVVLDGDGSLLMKMGVLATIGHYAPPNLLHVVLDNERHESTGGQSTVSTTADFARIATGAGYRSAYGADARSALVAGLDALKDARGPSLIHQKVRVDTDPNLGRPTIPPHEVARRFRRWLAGDAA